VKSGFGYLYLKHLNLPWSCPIQNGALCNEEGHLTPKAFEQVRLTAKSQLRCDGQTLAHVPMHLQTEGGAEADNWKDCDGYGAGRGGGELSKRDRETLREKMEEGVARSSVSSLGDHSRQHMPPLMMTFHFGGITGTIHMNT
jgi:hypothetical protein